MLNTIFLMKNFYFFSKTCIFVPKFRERSELTSMNVSELTSILTTNLTP